MVLMEFSTHFQHEDRDDYLTVEYFKNLKRSKIIVLGYNWINQGLFLWEHKKVSSYHYHYGIEHRVSGCPAQLNDDRKPVWMKEDEYLYEFEGLICRGSGAEPLYLVSDDHKEYIGV